MIKSVIFDMDGVLIDSEPLWQEVEIEVFGSYGVPMTVELSRQTMAMRVDKVVEHWVDYFNLEKSLVNKIVDQILEKVVLKIKEKGEPIPGAMEALEKTYDLGIPLAVATSSHEIVVDAVMERLGIRKFLKIVHSAEHEKRAKPFPDVYLTTASKLGIDPEYCLAIEDSPNGVLSAKAAGMKCIAIPSEGVEDHEAFRQADLKLKSFNEFNVDYLRTL